MSVRLRAVYVILVLCFTVLAVTAGRAAAQQTVTVNVASTAGPWSYVNGGLNSAYQYGVEDNTAPVVINAANGLLITPGATITIQYLSGLVSAGQATLSPTPMGIAVRRRSVAT